MKKLHFIDSYQQLIYDRLVKLDERFILRKKEIFDWVEYAGNNNPDEIVNSGMSSISGCMEVRIKRDKELLEVANRKIK